MFTPLIATCMLIPPMENLIREFVADESAIRRAYAVRLSKRQSSRLRELYQDWQLRQSQVNFSSLDEESKVDFVLLKNLLTKRLRELDLQATKDAETQPLHPFAEKLAALEESRRNIEDINPEGIAKTLTDVTEEVKSLKSQIGKKLKAPKVVANRATREIQELRTILQEWDKFYSGYDPMFNWWVTDAYKKLDQELSSYAADLRQELAGLKPDDEDAIVGSPVGRDALLADLDAEMIPYSPEDLIKIADTEFAWCEKEMKKASQELGFGDNWKQALEHVKGLHVAPGEQPSLVRKLAVEAVKFLEDRDLLTVPPIAKETWRISMMSPQAQKTNPFFLGGEMIIVSYPTDTMSYDEKLMSMRGNNQFFSRATVQHELIPGHGLQEYYETRYRPYRNAFWTPFWVEGWALYWEMVLWDLGFAQKPEEKIGMLFWRMHRCARIIFSLKFHLGEMTPEQCIDFLVDRVGHERANAEGEVRRSFSGDYPPLYQLAYMIGGLQFRALHHELVDSGKMSNRDFHDAILKENQMPVEMVRAILTHQPISKDFQSAWKFSH